MKKGGFNMYLTKERPGAELYKNYAPKYPHHQETETKVYVANVVGADMSKRMKATVECMATNLAYGLFQGGKNGKGK